MTQKEFSREIKSEPSKWNLVLVKFVTTAIGFWPENQNKFLANFIFINVVLSTIGNISDLGRFHTTAEDRMQGLISVTGLLQVTAKIATFIVYRNQLKKIIVTVWNNFWRTDTAAPSMRNKISTIAIYNRRLIYIYTICMGFTVFMFLQGPLLTADQRLLMFTTYPFDIRKGHIYELLYVWQWFAGVSCIVSIASYDLLFVTLVFLCIAQFQIIASNLELIGSWDDNAKITFVSHFDDDHTENSLDVKVLSKCVQQHNLLIQTCQEIETCFNYSLLCHLLLTVASVCCCSFAMMVNRDNLVQYGMIAIVLLFELLFFCWFGEQFTHCAASVADAAYASRWYDVDVKLRKSLLLIIQNSQQELALTGGGFTKLCLNTMVQILKFTYSVFTLLREVIFKK